MNEPINNLFTYSHLKQIEDATLIKTKNTYEVWNRKTVDSINLFLAIPYYLNENYEIESPEGAYYSIAFNHYLRIPYSFEAIFSLINQGYYLESLIIIRNLYEILVQLRYFHTKKEFIKDYSIKKKRITFKTMFDSISEELYEIIYSLLSNISHGGISSINFRVVYKAKEKGRVIHGPEYNEISLNYVISHQLKLIYGYLNHAMTFFPSLINALPNDLILRSNELKEWIDGVIKDAIINKPESKKFHNIVNVLIK